MGLDEYHKKRKFSETDEPKGKKKTSGSSFVVQRHSSHKLHWDFRLEVEGVMPSWAITKEPNDKDRRLAIKTEDHPVEYAKFHGIIPEGQYGAGTVEIWDNGKYENLRKISMKEAIEQGKIEVKIKGKKLNGNYAFIRMKATEKYPENNNWLFFRMKDEK